VKTGNEFLHQPYALRLTPYDQRNGRMSAFAFNGKREQQASWTLREQEPPKPPPKATSSNVNPPLKVAVPKMSDFGGDDDDVGG